MTSNSDSELWKNLPWKKFRKNLFRLQCRVWKAIRVGDRKRANSLQKLILKSRSARLLAIRQVTQLNQGKKTAGVDGKASLNYKQRLELDNLLKEQVHTWTHNKLREISIPKKDGTQRILKVPTIADRAWQCIIKYILEPAHEAIFHPRSYGFRPSRSAHDAQKYLFDNLRSKSHGKDKIILEMDIEKMRAPRQLRRYPQPSWERIRRTSLGQPTNLESKDKRDNSILVKPEIERRR